jgi:hypothetical protein
LSPNASDQFIRLPLPKWIAVEERNKCIIPDVVRIARDPVDQHRKRDPVGLQIFWKPFRQFVIEVEDAFIA